MNNVIFYLALIALVFSACKKDEGETTQVHQPVITFLSPAQSQQLDEKDTLWIRVNIASEDDLHEYLVQVRSIAEDKIVYSYEGHSHDKSAAINLYMMPDVSVNTEMELIVTTLDHSGNKSSRSISFVVLNTINTPKPVITLLSPTAVMYNDGEKLAIKGYVTHSSNLAEVQVELMQNDVKVFSFIPASARPDSAGFDTTYTISSPAYSDFELVIKASDGNGNAAVKTQTFHVHP